MKAHIFLVWCVSMLLTCIASAALSREEIARINFNDHILAVYHFGSALEPDIHATAWDQNGYPTKFSVHYKSWATEQTYRPMPAGQPRREFLDYLWSDGGMFQNYKRLRDAGKVNRVVIYIHGGLNFITGAGAKAAELTPVMLNEGIYPIFIVWSSNLFDTYGEHLIVREGMRQPGKGLITLPFQLVADLGTAVARAPLAMTKLFYNDLYHLAPDDFSRHKQAEDRFHRLQEVYREPGTQGERGKPIAVSSGSDGRQLPKKTEDVVSWSVFLPLKASTTPIIDSLGSAAWFNMLRRTRVMFSRESSFVSTEATDANLKLQSQFRYYGREGAVRLFLEEAQNGLTKLGGDDPHITLIGHSMGAIIAGEMLFCAPGIHYENVVFMAAASTINDFKYKVVPYLEFPTNKQTRFYNLCLNTANETGERQPWEHLEIAPRGSLLVWIDSMFDNPISEDDRTMGRWENAILATDWFPSDLPGRTTIKGFGRDRLSDTADLPFGPYESKPPTPPRKYLAEPSQHGEFSKYGAAQSPSFRFWDRYYWEAEPQKDKPTVPLPKSAGTKPRS
jgi:pimeloyl-ACP methyl ester carboxylesterase